MKPYLKKSGSANPELHPEQVLLQDPSCEAFRLLGTSSTFPCWLLDGRPTSHWITSFACCKDDFFDSLRLVLILLGLSLETCCESIHFEILPVGVLFSAKCYLEKYLQGNTHKLTERLRWQALTRPIFSSLTLEGWAHFLVWLCMAHSLLVGLLFQQTAIFSPVTQGTWV